MSFGQPDDPLAPETLPPEAVAWLESEDASTPMPEVDLLDLHRYAAARAGVERRIAEARAIRQRTVAQADAWLEGRLAPLQREAARLDLALTALLAQHRARNPRSKTLHAGFGVTVSQRARPARFVRLNSGAADNAALVRWLRRSAAAYIRVREDPAWGDLAAEALAPAADGGVVLRETGERLPDALGIRFEPAGDGEPKVEVALEEGDAGGR